MMAIQPLPRRRYSTCRIATRRALGLLFSLLLAAALLIVLAGTPATALGAEREPFLPQVFRAGFLATIYHDIDRHDAQAATELLAREISRNMGLATSPRVVIFQQQEAMVAAIRRGELDMVSMPTLDYLRIRKAVPLIPAVVGSHNGGRGTSYSLIVRRDSGLKKLADLKGRSLLQLPSTKHEPSQLWLELLLAKSAAGQPRTFFSTIKDTQKTSQAIMAVFFKQADAAIVTLAAFDTSRALNPQLGRELSIIAQSDYFSDGITCFPESLPSSTRAIISAAISNLNVTTTGRQLYTIFQTSGTTPFKPAFLEGLEKLLQERSQLRFSATKRKYHGTIH